MWLQRNRIRLVCLSHMLARTLDYFPVCVFPFKVAFQNRVEDVVINLCQRTSSLSVLGLF